MAPSTLSTHAHHPAASARLYAAVVLAVALASLSLLFQWAQFPRERLALLQGSVPTLRDLKLGCRGSPRSLSEGWTPLQLALEHKQWIQEWVLTEVPSLVRAPRRQLTLELGVGAILAGVEGDFVETGVAAGGTAILLAKVLEEYDEGGSRVLWAADSFDGLPPPTQEDAEGAMIVGMRGQFNHSREAFVSNLEEFEVQMDRVQVLKGWFNESLPQAGIKRIAYLRLDGDLYSSTMDALEALYSLVSPGGFVYVDDYGSYNGCRAAVDKFRSERGIDSPLQYQAVPDMVYDSPANESAWEAVWWVKGW